MTAASHRAAQQILEHGRIFSDPLTVANLGADQNELVHQSRQTPSSRRMRLFISIRTRFAEEALAAAYKQGVRQYLVMGAGLDTYAYRRALTNGLRVFEVDDPATQAFKHERLAAADIRLPSALTHVAVDFEHESCADRLAEAGFDRTVRTLVTWLGVVPYLTDQAIWSVLGFVGGLPGGAQIVFDYSTPPHSPTTDRRKEQRQRAEPVAELGLSYFDTVILHDRLHSIGFAHLDDLGPVQIAQRYLPEVSAPVSDAGGHIILAATA